MKRERSSGEQSGVVGTDAGHVDVSHAVCETRSDLGRWTPLPAQFSAARHDGSPPAVPLRRPRVKTARRQRRSVPQARTGDRRLGERG